MIKKVEAALNVVKDFISGQSAEAKLPQDDNQELRKAVAAELVAAMGRGTQEGRAAIGDQATADGSQSDEQRQLEKEQVRSRQLFMEQGYFDDAVQDLRAGQSGADRAAAARALGLAGSQRATAHLIAAMFDDDVEVRSAAGEALNQIGDPAVPNTPKQDAFVPQTARDLPPPEVPPLDGETKEAVAEEVPSPLATEDSNEEPSPAPDVLDTAAQSQNSVLQVAEVSQSAMVEHPTAGSEEEQLLLEEHAVRETVEQYENQLVESAALRQKAENEARWRADRETKIRLEAEARKVEEEYQRKRAEEEAVRRRGAEQEALVSEHTARLQAEAEAHRLAQEEARLRLENNKLRQAAEELARQRRQIETNRREATEAARHAEATRTRLEAEKRHQDELERLQNEEQGLSFAVEETFKRRSELLSSRQNAENEIASLKEARNQLIAAAEAQIKQLKEEREQLLSAAAARRAEAARLLSEAEERKRSEEQQLQQQMDTLRSVTADISARRFEVEAARGKAEQDAELLAASLTRMRAAEEARGQAEKERLQVEAATNERVELEQRLLDEARRRAMQEQSRLDEEKRRHDESEEQRTAALVALHQKTELEARERAEKERQLRAEIDHMRIADAEVRRRIEEAETLRRSSEQAYKSAAEKVQRIEAEAHATAQQEEQILTRLESVRRNVAAEAQARAEQEKRVKQEIEQFRRLQDEERPRLEAAILQRTNAAARFQQMRESRSDVTSASEEDHQVVGTSFGNTFAGLTDRDQSVSDIAPLRLVSDSGSQVDETMDDDLPVIDGPARGQPAVDSYLNSVDPYKRAAAISELARSQGKDAFALISGSFDDPSAHVRNAAARALCQLGPAGTVDLFNRALEDASEERRRNVGSAIAGSGLALEAIDKLASDSREDTYNSLSILFVMAKTGELQPLVTAVEQHPNDEVAQAVVKLLALSGQAQLAETAMKKRHGEE